MIRLVSANIEGDLHLDLVLPFLRKQQPDVICLQEVFGSDIPVLTGPSFQSFFLPMSRKINRSGDLADWGLAIASRLSVQKSFSDYYYCPVSGIVAFDEILKRDTVAQGIAGITLAANGAAVTVVATHFTWTPDGAPNHAQDADIIALLDFVKPLAPHVLCGDFNIPRRQNRHYQTLTAHYTDQVPKDVRSSIYVPLHYARHKPGIAQKLENLMVDYIFSTPGAYRVSNVELHGGISDHYALTAEIDRYQHYSES